MPALSSLPWRRVIFIRIDRIPEALFRLLHAAGYARVAGKVE
jgi:hypothetical protein